MELKIELDSTEDAANIIRSLNYTISEVNGRSINLPIERKSDIAKINKALVEAGVEVYGLQSSAETLESIFLNITKKLN